MIRKKIHLLAFLVVFSLAIYFFVRVYFFWSKEMSVLDTIFASLLLTGETYMVVHSLGYAISIARLGKVKKLYRRKHTYSRLNPEVAVAVVARHEPKEVLEQTFIALNGLKYANKKLYLLDGSTENDYITEDQKLCANYGVIFFGSTDPRTTKGRIINNFLRSIQSEYVALFDADQNPFPDFLEKVVSVAEGDKKIAFVQTPQYYSNADVSPIARGASMQQSIFFEGTCESKGAINAMFFCGTNALFRRKILLECGGIDELSVTEDFSTSVDIHVRGYKSIYYNHVRVFGMAPESLPGYFRQQARWASGSTGVLRKVVAYFFKNPFSMSLDQWWEYFLSGSYYFLGWSFFLLVISPVAYLILGVPSYFLSPGVYLATYVPYFLMTFGMFYITMKKRNYGLGEVYNGVIMGSLSFPVTMVASLKGLLGIRQSFKITPKGKSEQLSVLELLPWLTMIILCATAIAFGIVKFRQDPYAVATNMFWCGYHLFILTHIFKLNRAPKIPSKPVYAT